jgi:hypothetical protein
LEETGGEAAENEIKDRGSRIHLREGSKKKIII